MLEKVVIGLMSDRKEVRVRLAGIQWKVYPVRKDCVKAHAYTKRTPGLFKLEYYGDGIVCLCSKTYFTSNLFEDTEYSDDVRCGRGTSRIHILEVCVLNSFKERLS